jgi:hypothetical protein
LKVGGEKRGGKIEAGKKKERGKGVGKRRGRRRRTKI